MIIRKFMSIGAACALIMTSGVSIAQASDPERPFIDVPQTSEHVESITWLKDTGLSTGWADGTFRPTSHITRAAMAAFIYRFADPESTAKYEKPANVRSCFKDIQGNEFEKEICWMKDAGLSTGWYDNTFRPYAPIERQAVAAFMYRLSQSKSTDVRSGFPDVPANSQFAKEITWAKNVGLTKGWADGKYRPLDPMQRDGMAVYLNKFSDNIRPVHSVKLATHHVYNTDIDWDRSRPFRKVHINTGSQTNFTGQDQQWSSQRAHYVDYEGNPMKHSWRSHRHQNRDKSWSGSHDLIITGSKGKQFVFPSVITWSSQSNNYQDRVARETFDKINNYRASHGLPKLQWTDKMERVAKCRTKQLDDYYNLHRALDNHAGIKSGPCSGNFLENIAYSSRNTSNEMFGLWRNSPPHNRGMLWKGITKGAVSVYLGKSGIAQASFVAEY